MNEQIKELLSKYDIKETNKDNKNFYSVIYDYKIELKNLNTDWYIKIELPTKKCKFYAIYTRFTNCDVLNKINKVIKCNTYSGKCNRFPYDLIQMECFINNVINFDKLQ